MSILRLLTETSKIRLAIVAVICILIFYAVGIDTNLFASPAFSMFWIISAETARGVVLYVAAALAIVLGAGMATFFWLIKRGSENSNSLDNLVLAVDKSKTESVDSYDSATFEMAAEEENHEENKKLSSDMQPIEEPVASRSPVTTREAILASARVQEFKAESTTKKNVGFRSAKAEQQNRGKLYCSSCKKEVTQPLVIVNSDETNPKISRYCPECEKLIDEIEVNLHPKAKNTEQISFEVASFEEVYNK